MRVQKKTKKGLIITLSVVIALIVMGFMAYLYLSQPAIDNSTDTNAQTETSQTTDNESTPDEATNSTTNTPSTSSNSQEQTIVEGKTPVQYEGQTPEDTPSTDNERFRIPEDQ